MISRISVFLIKIIVIWYTTLFECNESYEKTLRQILFIEHTNEIYLVISCTGETNLLVIHIYKMSNT
jgi:hypothetical protein